MKFERLESLSSSASDNEKSQWNKTAWQVNPRNETEVHNYRILLFKLSSKQQSHFRISKTIIFLFPKWTANLKTWNKYPNPISYLAPNDAQNALWTKKYKLKLKRTRNQNHSKRKLSVNRLKFAKKTPSLLFVTVIRHIGFNDDPK